MNYPSEGALKSWVKGRVKKGRYKHILGVYEIVDRLAQRYSADSRRLRIAALLHDCARDMPREALLEVAEANGLEIRPFDRTNPILLHGPVAANIAREEWGITDVEILESISYHTSGKPGMSDFEKIFFIADKIEPTRSYQGVEQLRKKVLDNLEEGFRMVVDSVVSHQQRKGNVIDPRMIELYQALTANP